MRFAFRENFRRKQFAHPEELEFDRVAAGIRRHVDETKRAGEVLPVITGCLCDEFGGQVQLVHLCLTLLKHRMAKTALTMGKIYGRYRRNDRRLVDGV